MTHLITIFIFTFAVVIHEVSHGWVAWKLGDPTARMAGRLTLNPMAHIDPIGTILVPLILLMSGSPVVGWAKPVPVDFSRMANPKKDMIWVGLAGPGANIFFAVILSVVLRFFNLTGAGDSASVLILSYAILINLILAIFNMMPIPPLDGSRVLMGILPRRFALKYAMIEPFGIFILLAMVMLGIVARFIWPLVILTSSLLGVRLQ